MLEWPPSQLVQDALMFMWSLEIKDWIVLYDLPGKLQISKCVILIRMYWFPPFFICFNSGFVLGQCQTACTWKVAADFHVCHTESVPHFSGFSLCL